MQQASGRISVYPFIGRPRTDFPRRPRRESVPSSRQTIERVLSATQWTLSHPRGFVTVDLLWYPPRKPASASDVGSCCEVETGNFESGAFCAAWINGILGPTVTRERAKHFPRCSKVDGEPLTCR